MRVGFSPRSSLHSMLCRPFLPGNSSKKASCTDATLYLKCSSVLLRHVPVQVALICLHSRRRRKMQIIIGSVFVLHWKLRLPRQVWCMYIWWVFCAFLSVCVRACVPACACVCACMYVCVCTCSCCIILHCCIAWVSAWMAYNSMHNTCSWCMYYATMKTRVLWNYLHMYLTDWGGTSWDQPVGEGLPRRAVLPKPSGWQFWRSQVAEEMVPGKNR